MVVTTRSKPDSCLGCACASHGTDFSAIEGTGSSHVMLVGEASGEMEARDQLPFRPYAPAGSVLERILRRMSLDREQFSITNVLRCRPRNNWLDGAPYEHAALNHCRPNLDRAIAERRPRAIVALGGIATRELTGLAGNALGVTHLAGYVLPYARRGKVPCPDHDTEKIGGENVCFMCDGTGFVDGWLGDTIPIIPNFHPAFLRRGKASYQGVFARILQRAMNVAAGRDHNYQWNIHPEEDQCRDALGYQTRPTVAQADAYSRRVLASPQLTVSYDIETNESTSLDEDAREGFADTYIRLVQFAVEGAGAIAIPWEREFYPAITSVLRSPNTKCGHNVWLFDNKVLRAAGEREGIDVMPRGTVHDTLQMFHHWQPDLPAHLQFAASFIQFPFPWKHLAGTDIEFYGCCDVDATLRLYTMLERTLRRDELWGGDQIGYLGQVHAVRPVLERMEQRGMPIDDAERIRLGDEFERAQLELGAGIAKRAPGECRRVHPKGVGYVGVPPEVKAWLVEHPHAMLYQTDISETRFKDSSDDPEYYHYEQHEFAVPSMDAASGAPVVLPTLRWCRVYDFNPNSRPQVLAYMKSKGHPIPKDKHREDADGENPDTTNAKELMRLANKTGDDFYLKVIEYRGLTKMRGTYVDGFAPGPDGCVHTTFTFDTSIGQLSSRNPNCQNFPKLKPTPALAKALRKMVAAKPGKILVEWDYKSFHALTLGFLAEDPVWMRLARLDLHSFVTGYVLNLWDTTILRESDAELMARFKWLKSNPAWKLIRDDQAKHAGLGIGNGLHAKGLYERYMESFPPRACTECVSGRVKGLRGMKNCPRCKGLGFLPGIQVAQMFLDALEVIAPKVFAYQRAERRAAHTAGDRGYYSKFYGFARRFYEVYSFNKRWNPERDPEPPPGDQSEEAVSFRHTNIAHCEVRARMKELDALGMAEAYGMYNQIHDALQFHSYERDLEQHVRDVYPVLIAPSKVLKNETAPNGLVIGVDGSWGYRWSDMTEITVASFIEPKPAELARLS